MVKVSGRVLIDGKPVEHGFVQVAPDGYRAAMAPIGKDGRFTLSTSPDADGDGVAIGTHPAAVIALENLTPGSQRWHAPKKYNSITTSNLTVVIDGTTDDLVINLTWKDSGQKGPYVESSGGRE